MRLVGLFNAAERKCSQEGEALRKILAKLDRTHDRLENSLKAEQSKANQKHLEIRLRTNKRQREKAEGLLAELVRKANGANRHSNLSR